MRQLFFYEAPEDGGGADDSEPIDQPEAAVETPEVTPEETPPWALNEQDWQQTVQYLQQTAPILQAVAQYLPQLQQQANPAPAAEEAPEIDPFDPASVRAYIQHEIQAGIQSGLTDQLGPYEGMLGMVASEQGEALARRELETIKSDIGEFDHDTAFLIAAGAIEGGQDPAVALRHAATYSRDWEKRIRDDERTRYQTELKTLGGAPGEVPIGSAAGTEVQPVPTGPRRYHEAVERVLARQNPTNVVG